MNFNMNNLFCDCSDRSARKTSKSCEIRLFQAGENANEHVLATEAE